MSLNQVKSHSKNDTRHNSNPNIANWTLQEIVYTRDLCKSLVVCCRVHFLPDFDG